ncbi:hypothetical protein BO71DRAFT_417090 [Aspergillus ellipticus CBS 707.79]|uniref:Rhodopsin domain-containing protein n=1 Tax=Aspergillus ellipticus CBS 707.79 TaxID=1448320 RepID=A0A319DIM2_9EURO|nr:hypothetical protein BO71DRAFT_417090 [Aspergillus ellipticus CBS 707.79]
MLSFSSELLPPLEAITPDNRGPILTVVAFNFLFVTLIVVVVKFGSTLYSKTLLLGTDAPLLIALVIAFIQSLLIQFVVDNGLGKHASSIPADALNQYNKVSAQLLLILVLSLSKVSTCRLIYRITPGQHIRRASMITLITIGLWTVFAIFATAFQCRPQWRYLPSQCAGEGTIAYPIMVFNILIDLALVVIPLVMLWNVQIALQKRLQIFAAFSSRLLVYLPTNLHSNDPTWTIVNVNICNELMMMYLSIIAACMPSIYRILSSLRSGLNDVHLSNIELNTVGEATGSGTESRDQAHPNYFRKQQHSTFFPGFRSTDLFSMDESATQNGLLTIHGGFRRGSEDAVSTESTRRLTENQPSDRVRETVDI